MTLSRHNKSPFKINSNSDSAFLSLWDYFWHKPEQKCPTCGSELSEYYDPFFFSPLRTLNGKRRLKCSECQFVWRSKKSGKSFFEKIFPRI